MIADHLHCPLGVNRHSHPSPYPFCSSSVCPMVADDAEDPDSSSLTLAAPRGRSCKGLLYFSSSRKNKGCNPLCYGLSRPEDKVHIYTGKSEQDATKDGKALLEFRYACLGYSVHQENQATSSLIWSEKQAELPFCMGIEFLAEKRTSSAVRQGQMNQKDDHKSIEAAPVMSRPPSSARPPSMIGSFTPEEFSSRFIRSAGLVAAAVGKNLSRVGNSIKSMADDIFYPDRRRPK